MEVLGAIQSQEMREGNPVFNFRSSEPRPNKASADKEKLPSAAPRADPVADGDQGQKIERVTQSIDNYLKSAQSDLQIKVHNDTGTIVVKVVSKSDGKVIREIPPEEMLNLAAKMEALIGALFNKNV
jgi:flagellar protein FlaG